MPQQSKTKVDVLTEKTDKKGFHGFYELLLRRFKNATYFVTLLPIYITGSLILGLGIFPAYFLYRWTELQTIGWELPFHYLAMSLSLGLGYFVFGSTLVLIVPVFNYIFRLQPKPYRGPFYSVDIVRWYLHNSLTYVVRFTFLEWITPTPFNLLFFRMMGMKIGKHTHVNTSMISDPGLIIIGDRVTIGGSASLCGHYGMAGYLVLAPLIIHDGVTIGLRATLLGGVEIGAEAKVLPNSVVLPNTKIPPGETWGGVPARKMAPEDFT